MQDAEHDSLAAKVRSSVTGTFTRLFGRKPEAPGAADAPRRRRLSIRLLKRGSADAAAEAKPVVSWQVEPAAAAPADAPSAAAAAENRAEAEGPGEFTEEFGPPSVSPAAPTATPTAGGAGKSAAKPLDRSTSDILRSLDPSTSASDQLEPPPELAAEESATPGVAEAPPPPGSAPTTEAKQPSEFTQVVSGHRPPARASAPVSSPAEFFERRREKLSPLSPSRPPGFRLFVVGLTVILIVAVLVVYVFTRL
jgi:hypothetical protein